ncbi:MAG: PEP-CTERM sorting domain-containing protein [Pirellulales bacterium]|nr:PEP-CTERM sorting domain-containing protein [Pirellulales bacterium]
MSRPCLSRLRGAPTAILLGSAVVFSSFAGPVQAVMILGAIGNDGTGPPGAFDGSITATASTTISTGNRQPFRAINGDGVVVNGDANDANDYESDAGTNSFGENCTWMPSTARTTGWFKVDLGQAYALNEAWFFNFNPSTGGGGSGNEDRGVNAADVYYLNAAADPNGNTNGNDSAFDSTGWTQLGSTTNFTIAPAGDVNQATPDVINFGGAVARFVAFNILSNHGDENFVGIGEVQFFSTELPAVPEPSSLLLVALSVLGLGVYGRRGGRTRGVFMAILLGSAMVLGGGVDSTQAATVVENFESQTPGSSTIPAGWSLITASGAPDTPSYATSAAGDGSDGAGASSGLAGVVSTGPDSISGKSDMPTGLLVNTTDFDLTSALTGTFDFLIQSDGDFDDVVFTIGAIADGITTTTADELLTVKFTEGTQLSALTDGTGDATNRFDTNATSTPTDTWFTASVIWTPTSGTTGDFSITINDFSSDLFTLSTTGFTFGSATAQIGFGSVNDTIRFDNVNFATVVPEPSSLTLAALGIVGLSLRPRRRRG